MRIQEEEVAAPWSYRSHRLRSSCHVSCNILHQLPPEEVIGRKEKYRIPVSKSHIIYTNKPLGMQSLPKDECERSDDSLRSPQRSSSKPAGVGEQVVRDHQFRHQGARAAVFGPEHPSTWSEVQHCRQLLLMLSNQNIRGVHSRGNTLDSSSGVSFRYPNIAGPAYDVLRHGQRNLHGLESDGYMYGPQNLETNAALLANLRWQQSTGYSSSGRYDASVHHALGKPNEARLFREPTLSERIARLRGSTYDDDAALVRDQQLAQQARLVSSLHATKRADSQLSNETRRIGSAVASSYEQISSGQSANLPGKLESSGQASSLVESASRSEESSSGTTTVTVSDALQKIKKPSRPLTSYNIFFKEIRSSIIAEKAAGDRMSFTDMGKLIGAKWKALSDEEKQPYLEKAKVAKSRHKRDMEEYSKRREDIMSSYHSTQLRSVSQDVMNRYYQEHQGHNLAPKRRKQRQKKGETSS